MTSRSDDLDAIRERAKWALEANNVMDALHPYARDVLALVGRIQELEAERADLLERAVKADDHLAMTQLGCSCDDGDPCYCMDYPSDVQIAKARAALTKGAGE